MYLKTNNLAAYKIALEKMHTGFPEKANSLLLKLVEENFFIAYIALYLLHLGEYPRCATNPALLTEYQEKINQYSALYENIPPEITSCGPPAYVLDTIGLYYKHAKQGLPPDECQRRARHYFEVAANSGYASAQYNLACFYESVCQPSDACKWLNKAIVQEFTLAKFKLGYHINTVPLAEKKQYLIAASNEGLGEASMVLFIYQSDYQLSLEQANNYLLTAAEQNYIIAQTELADNLVQGLDCAKDVTQALRWYEKAALQGEVSAILHMAIIHEYGLTGQRNLPEAVKRYQCIITTHADSSLCRYAYYRLGRIFEQGGIGIDANRQKAIEYYKQANELDQATEKTLLSKYKDQAAKAKIPKFAAFRLGVLYQDRNGITVDVIESVRFYTLAAENGLASIPEAKFCLARCYEMGWGVAKDEDRALQLYQDACIRNSKIYKLYTRVGVNIYQDNKEEDELNNYICSAYFEVALFYKKSIRYSSQLDSAKEKFNLVLREIDSIHSKTQKLIELTTQCKRELERLLLFIDRTKRSSG